MSDLHHPSRANLALTLGFIGIFVCPLLAPYAWVIAREEGKRVREGAIPRSGALTGAWILGMLGTLGLLVWVGLAIAWLTALSAGIGGVFTAPPASL